MQNAWVSTDDDQIASLAEDCHAKVIRRPADLAGEDSPTVDAIMHALQYLDYNVETS